MAGNLYFLTALTEAPSVKQRVHSIIPEGDLFELAGDKWMVVYEGTGQDLAESAGIRSGDQRIGTGLVMPVTTYNGRAPTPFWDWLKAKGV
jgi:hypothetical protein